MWCRAFSALSLRFISSLHGPTKILVTVLLFVASPLILPRINICLVAVDLLNTIFFLSSFIDLAVNIDDINCSNYFDSYCDIYGCYTRNLDAAITLCQEVQVASGIAAFSFLLWLVAAIWVITFIVVGYRRRGRGVETNVEQRGKEVEGQTNTASEAMAGGRMEDPIV